MERVCECCGRVIEKGEAAFRVDGQVWCRECYDEKFPKCPNCREPLVAYPEADMSCPVCTKRIYVEPQQKLFASTLLTRRQVMAMEEFEERLLPLGIRPTQYIYMRQKLTRERQALPDPIEVVDILEDQVAKPSAKRAEIKREKQATVKPKSPAKKPEFKSVAPDPHQRMDTYDLSDPDQSRAAGLGAASKDESMPEIKKPSTEPELDLNAPLNPQAKSQTVKLDVQPPKAPAPAKKATQSSPVKTSVSARKVAPPRKPEVVKPDPMSHSFEGVSTDDLERELEEMEMRKKGIDPVKAKAQTETKDEDDVLAEGELPGADKPVAKKVVYANAQQELAHRGLSLLKPYGLKSKHFLSKEKQLRAKLNRQPSAAEVIKGLLPYAYARSDDFQKMAICLIEMSRLFVAAKEDAFTLQQYWARNHLLMLQEDGVEFISIERGPDYCTASRELNGKEYTIDQAIIELPIPSPDCDLCEKSRGRLQCRCDYAPLVEEEAFEDVPKGAGGSSFLVQESFFEQLTDDEDFRNFLDEIKDDED